MPGDRVSFENTMEEWAGAPGKRHSSYSETENKRTVLKLGKKTEMFGYADTEGKMQDVRHKLRRYTVKSPRWT